MKTAEIEFIEVKASETEPIEVEATEVEPQEIQLMVNFEPTAIEQNFEEVEAFVKDAIKWMVGFQMGSASDYKLAKKFRSNLNTMTKEFNSRRIAAKKLYMAPWDAFETRFKEIDALITVESENIDKQIKECEEFARQRRLDALKNAYEEFAPTLVEVVPFERLMEKSWLLSPMDITGAEVKAVNALQDKVAAIASEWEAFRKLELEFKDQAEIVFFGTFSLASAIKENERLIAERQRIDALRANVLPPEPKVEPTPELEPIVETHIVSVTISEPQETFRLELTCTNTELRQVIDYCKQNGIHGRLIKEGSNE